MKKMPYRLVNLMEAFFKIRIPSSQICLGLCQHRPQRVGHGLTMQLRLAMDSLCNPGWPWTHCAAQAGSGLTVQTRIALD